MAKKKAPDRLWKDLQAELDKQMANIKKSNPEVHAALARIPRKNLLELARIRAAQTELATVPPPAGPTAYVNIKNPPPGAPNRGNVLPPAQKLLTAERLGVQVEKGPGVIAGGAGARGVGDVAKKGLSKAAKVGAGVGLAAGVLMPFFSASPLSLPGRGQKSKELAVKGFAALGASSSSEALAEIVRQQELAARRQIVLQQYEPDMFNQVLNVLAGTNAGPMSITSTERQIGSNVEKALPARRPDNDIKFLLDQLLAEASS